MLATDSLNMNNYKKFYYEDTIAAISTPMGIGAIGVVRISGPRAEAVAMELFRPKGKIQRLESHKLYYGKIINPEDGSLVDEVLLTLMKKPKTFTCEDVVEINCHGGHLIVNKVLELVLKQGTRLAEPGEFTKRAFLNGRIDLTQAESIIDLIQSRTEAGLRVAQSLLKGDLSKEITQLKNLILEALAFLEAYIDFPEEEIENQSQLNLWETLDFVSGKIQKLLNSYEQGRIYREGANILILGKPNVGKSTLFNCLMKEKKAIVTPYPGTTRDIIEDMIYYKGIPLRFLDTAGLRKANDPIEGIGIELVKEKIPQADVIIFLLDKSQGITEEDLEIYGIIRDRKFLGIVNKDDLPLSPLDLSLLTRGFNDLKFEGSTQRTLTTDNGQRTTDNFIYISALKEEGIPLFMESLMEILSEKGGIFDSDGTFIKLRHKGALEKTFQNIRRAKENLERRAPLEILALDLRSVLNSLGEIVGEVTSEEILDKIFSQFCIGK